MTISAGARRNCGGIFERSEEHTSELQSLRHLVCRLLLEKKKPRAPRTSSASPAAQSASAASDGAGTRTSSQPAAGPRSPETRSRRGASHAAEPAERPRPKRAAASTAKPASSTASDSGTAAMLRSTEAGASRWNGPARSGASEHCAATEAAIASSRRFFFNDTAPAEIYTLSLHDALPI